MCKKNIKALTRILDSLLNSDELEQYYKDGFSLVGFTYNCVLSNYVYIFVKTEHEQTSETTQTTLLSTPTTPTPTRFMFKNALTQLGVSPQIASDWIKVRQAKKAAQTETAFKLIEKEIKIATQQHGVTANDIVRVAIDRNWQGIKATWFDNVDWSFYDIRTQRSISNKNAEWE